LNVYDKAIAVIEERGWVKNASHNDNGVCATYALMVAVFPELEQDASGWRDGAQITEYSASCMFVEKLLRDKGGISTHPRRDDIVARINSPRPFTIVGWNDMVAQDVNDVIHLLKEASEAWDLEHPE